MTKPSLPNHEAPFQDVRVLDFGQGVASPYVGYLLAANGADVIKVEPPEGDWSRRLGATYGSHSALSAVYNRGKRGLTLDLKRSEDVEAAKKLAADADVLIEGFRPGIMAGDRQEWLSPAPEVGQHFANGSAAAWSEARQIVRP